MKPHFQVDTTSRRRAGKHLQNRCCGYDRLLSIAHSDGSGACTDSAKITLRLKFDDVRRAHRGKVPPTEEDVRAIVNFAMGFRQGDMILVQTGNGWCRGAAAAMILYRARSPLTEEQIVAKVLKEIPKAQPSQMMLKIADKILGSQLLDELKKQRAT